MKRKGLIKTPNVNFFNDKTKPILKKPKLQKYKKETCYGCKLKFDLFDLDAFDGEMYCRSCEDHMSKEYK